MHVSNKNTVKNYKKAWEDFLKINDLKLIDLKKMKSSDISKLIDNTFNAFNYSARTKLLKISAVRSIIEYELDKVLPKSKARKEISKKVAKHTNKEEIKKEDIKLLIKHFETEFTRNKLNFKTIALRNLILIKLLAGTGQRISDILKLKVFIAKKQNIFFKQEKTGREVLIENPCMPEILSYISILKLSDDDFLFASGLSRSPLHYTQVNKVIKYAGLLILNKNITPHYFRAYVVTELRKLGYSNSDIQSISGHAESAMIDYYDKGEHMIKGTKNKLIE